jgi:hypothetical protein
MNIVPLEQLVFASFSGLLNSKFRVVIDAQNSVEVELVEITPPQTGQGGAGGRQTFENFSLIFLGPLNPVLPQKIYWFESAQLGRFEMFIVPVGQDQSGTRYQAIFSRLITVA